MPLAGVSATGKRGERCATGSLAVRLAAARGLGECRAGGGRGRRGPETLVAAGGAHRPERCSGVPVQGAQAQCERVCRAGRSQGWLAGPGGSHRARARRGEISEQGRRVVDASTAIARTCDVMIPPYVECLKPEEAAEVLAARGESPAAFDERCIPAAAVASRSNTTRYSPSARPVLAVRDIATPGSRCDAEFHHGLLALRTKHALENEKSPAILPSTARHFQPMTGLALLRLPALGVLALGALGTQQLDLSQQLVELAREHLGVARLGRQLLFHVRDVL